MDKGKKKTVVFGVKKKYDVFDLKIYIVVFQAKLSPTPPPHSSLRLLIPPITMKGPIHQIYFMGLITE